MTKGFGLARSLSYIYHMMKKMEKIELTIHEWKDALKVPSPHRNKKKYFRKEKYKNTWKPEE
jgi:hypothetical protein